MPGYRRFVAYVYAYRKGKKESNCGFIKVEVRDARCTMEVHLNIEGVTAGVECRIYGFVRKDGLMDGILLESCESGENSIECLIETDALNMGESGIPLGRMGGMIFTTQAGGFFGTEWDDQPIRPANFREMKIERETEGKKGQPNQQEGIIERDSGAEEGETKKQEQSEATPREEAYERGERNTEEIQTERTQAEKIQTGEIQAEEMQTEEPQAVQMQAEEIPAQSENRKSELEESDAIDVKRAQEFVKSEEKEGKPDPRPMQHGANPRPPQPNSAMRPRRAPWEMCAPFDDGDMIQCWKIHPGDFSCFPRNQCGLRNNRFLQYGHHNFGHLLLCRKSNGQYILGVPGSYDQQERFMANMFGFPYFKESRMIEVPKGRGGYWYRLIDAPDIH